MKACLKVKYNIFNSYEFKIEKLLLDQKKTTNMDPTVNSSIKTIEIIEIEFDIFILTLLLAILQLQAS